jgi:hypothetical protein
MLKEAQEKRGWARFVQGGTGVSPVLSDRDGRDARAPWSRAKLFATKQGALNLKPWLRVEGYEWVLVVCLVHRRGRRRYMRRTSGPLVPTWENKKAVPDGTAFCLGLVCEL